MNIRQFVLIASMAFGLSTAVFAQWHPEIDKIKGTQSVKSPRDVATGQATGRRKGKRPIKPGAADPQAVISPRDTTSGQATSVTSTTDSNSGQSTATTNLGDTATHEKTAGETGANKGHLTPRQKIIRKAIKANRTRQRANSEDGGTKTETLPPPKPKAKD